MVSRRTGRPMLCPVCEGDVYLDAPHVCAEGKVMPAAAGTTLTFYAYNATSRCCRDWMLVGWPQVDGLPKLTEGHDRGRLHFDCPKCKRQVWFHISAPDATLTWDVRAQGTPQPPALLAGRIRAK